MTYKFFIMKIGSVAILEKLILGYLLNPLIISNGLCCHITISGIILSVILEIVSLSKSE